LKDFKIGDEVEIVGQSRFKNGYRYGTIGVIIDPPISVESKENISQYLYVRSIKKNDFGWFSYHTENLKLSREGSINRLLEN